MLLVTVSMMVNFSGQSFADHPGNDPPRTCTATIEYLAGEMTAGRTYVQFHTDDGVPPQNTGPGDLASPGEIRGDITVDRHDPAVFAATADRAQNVFAHGADQAPWDGVTATADLSFAVQNHGAAGPHVTFSFDINSISNVVGIHMHNGAAGEANPVHLADFLTADASLISGIDGGPVASMDGTYTGTITAADLCPGAHAHGDGGGGAMPACTATIEYLAGEMTAGRTYVQFHTDDGVPPQNTGPGDLASPGEIRGDITVDRHDPAVFAATADRAQNVFAHGADQAPWDGVTATADLSFAVQNHGASGRDPAVAAPAIASPADASEITPTPTISGTSDPGVFVEVFSGTTSLGTSISDSSGSWSLSITAPLSAGPHTLTATATDGFGNSSEESRGVSVTVVDRLGAVSGTVFADADGDGTQDAGDAGISTAVYAIPYASPNTVLQTATDADGQYSFAGLVPGSYLVQITVPQGHTLSPGHDYFSRPVVPAGSPVTVNFALQKVDAASASSVSGVVFSDADGDGTQDAGEPGVEGVTVFSIGLLTAEINQAATDADGQYSFAGLAPGTTLVQTGVLPVGYLTVSGFDFYSYETLSPSSAAEVNFPLNEITPDETATLTGTIHEDDNANGLLDPREAGFNGVTVTAIELSTARILETTTDRRGSYTFTGLMPDTVLVQTGLIPADHLPQVGHAAFMYRQLGAGTTTTADFPMRHIQPAETATVSGVVYHDANSNGVQESAEPGLPNVRVTVYALTTGQLESSHTDADGNFAIAGVMPDTVLVQSAVPAGFSPSTSNGGFEYHALSDGQAKTVLFGFQGAGHPGGHGSP